MTTRRSATCSLRAAYRDGLPFDALILDCALPYVDGFAVARVVRCAEAQSEVFPRARVAFFTAFDKTVEKTTLLADVGADAYWPKDRAAHRIADLIEDFAHGLETPSFV
jgi:DNA-binding response OmpR family regulator